MPGYRLSLAAADDVADIFVTGACDFGVAQADVYHAGLERAFLFLADYPRAARLRVEISPPVRAFPYKAHLIVYDILGDDILILRVRHAREDWQHTTSEV